MAKYKIEDLRIEAINHGWELISTEYKNLDADLEYRCDKQHTVYISYKKIRKDYVCPLCKEFDGATEIEKVNAPIPKTKIERVLSLDQSTKVTGYAIFDGTKLICYDVVTMKDRLAPLRFIRLRDWLSDMIDQWQPDCVLLEDIQLQEEERTSMVKNSNTFKILAENLGVLEAMLTERGQKYEVIHTSTWRHSEQITGRNRDERKKQGQARISKCYNIEVTDDVSDAILIGRHYILNKETDVITW